LSNLILEQGTIVMFASKGFRLASLFAMIVMAVSMVSVDQAEARRGGSFGSRGTRTFQTAPATPTSPNVTAPVQRSMTPGQTTTTPRAGAQAAQPRSMFGGLGGALLGGALLGGLFGMFLGQGFGGMAGLFGLLVQCVLIFFVIRFVMGLLARNARQPATAGAGMNYSGNSGGSGPSPLGGLGSQRGSSPSRAPRGNPDELGVKAADLDRFEDMLRELQLAFGREDYSALRQLTTPEMMSYLSEELGENASRGVKNEVSEVKLLKGDVAESWREGNQDYATAAMHYSSIDVTRDRATGRIVEGDSEVASETTELWTFVRPRGGEWKLSAIQQA
jgi:predicted lipid-binding transport protein (Tim44 family)